MTNPLQAITDLKRLIGLRPVVKGLVDVVGEQECPQPRYYLLGKTTSDD